MGIIKLNPERISRFCDRIIELFIYILIFSLPFSKALIEICATFIILSWLLKRIVNRRILAPLCTYLNIPLLVFISAVFVSVIFSTNFALSFRSFFSKTMEYVLLFFITAEFIADKRRLKNVILLVLVSAMMIGADCIFQYFLGFDFLRLRTLEATRITGSFQMPTDLAGYLGPMLCLCLPLGFLKLKKRGIRYFVRIETVILLGLLLVTLARGAWLGFFAAICFLGLFENRRILYSSLLLLLIFSIIMPYLMRTPDNILLRMGSIFSFMDESSLDRGAIWQIALRMIKDRPIFGQGLSTFMGNFARFGPDYYYLKENIIPYAHNCYLQIAAETGLLGLAGFLALIGTFLVHTVRSLCRIKDRFNHAVLAGVSAGLIAILVHSAVDTNLYSLQLSVLFWIMLGLNAALQRNFKPGEAES